MSQRSVLEIAALASAAMPELSVATTRGSEQFLMSGDRKDIVTAVITSVEGIEYDVSVTSSTDGKSLLKDRARAAYVLSRSKGPVGLSFALENYTLYLPGDSAQDATGDNAVFISTHIDGDAVHLTDLTSQQCTAAGTSIAAIHRMRPGFLKAAKYRSYSALDIQNQLTSWIRNLEEAGHIPSEIIDNWKEIIATEGLWNFTSCPVHGGLTDGDILFLSNSVSAIRHWENMQINDPARDLAWVFTHLDKPRRDAFIAAYSRVMGNRLDNMIWLRAGLWTQMEQVGEYMRALTNADTAKILAFKSQVNSLAHQIAKNNPRRKPLEKKSTLTVGDLLQNPDAAQGKAETRARGGNSRKAAHTRFVVDSGMRVSPSTSSDHTLVARNDSIYANQTPVRDQAPVRAEMSDDSDSTINSPVNVPTPPMRSDATAHLTDSSRSDENQKNSSRTTAGSTADSPRKNWNLAPSQSQSFTFTSPSHVTEVSQNNPVLTDADAVADEVNSLSFTYDAHTEQPADVSDVSRIAQSKSYTESKSLVANEETIAMQAQSAATAAAHAQESATYKAYSEGIAYTAQSSYVRVDSNGFVLDDVEHSSRLNDVSDDTFNDDTANGDTVNGRVSEGNTFEDGVFEDNTGESAIAQDDIETTVFAAQEKIDRDDE
ncbi:phosphotransferase [Alloscardovia theropitheci]|uniref:Phosphotransferase n=1 Tax=Alloscardovia theropitheci TaxID=2496842 RepID=A0A4R0QQW0_9BIFI|nr:phosphotransferase [Alloscardovia theropitheci]TCD54722.1 phosphotransferase [Alloscardovia theropitheci]